MTITTEVAALRLVMARGRGFNVQMLDEGSEGRMRRRASSVALASRADHVRNEERVEYD